MDRFVSHFTNRLDAKGRISIPASFRTVLARDGFDGLFLLPNLEQPALDAGGHGLIAEIDHLLASVPALSGDRDALSTALYGTSEVLKIDPEGRVMLPDALKAHAGLKDAATFVGIGTKFQICEPDAFRARLDSARRRVRDLTTLLRESTRGPTPSAPSETEAFDVDPGARAR